jgi:hypothetical protein
VSYCGEKLPEWVPRGAIEEARKSLREFAYFSNEIAAKYKRNIKLSNIAYDVLPKGGL